MFSIGFLSLDAEGMALGQIILDETKDKFRSYLDYWDVDKYVIHWRAQVESFLIKERPACLLTSLGNPNRSNFVRCWAIYPQKENGQLIALFQEKILFMDQLDVAFDETRPEIHIAPIRLLSDGRRISNWHLSANHLSTWLEHN